MILEHLILWRPPWPRQWSVGIHSWLLSIYASGHWQAGGFRKSFVAAIHIDVWEATGAGLESGFGFWIKQLRNFYCSRSLSSTKANISLASIGLGYSLVWARKGSQSCSGAVSWAFLLLKRFAKRPFEPKVWTISSSLRFRFLLSTLKILNRLSPKLLLWGSYGLKEENRWLSTSLETVQKQNLTIFPEEMNDDSVRKLSSYALFISSKLWNVVWVWGTLSLK